MQARDRRTDTTRPPVYRLILVQIVVTLVVATGFLFSGWVAAYSALLGGLVYTVPNAFLLKHAFAPIRAGAVGHMLRSFYRGEFIKLFLAAVMFAAVLKWVRPLGMLAFVVTFVAVLISNSFAPVFWSTKTFKKL